MGVSGPHNYTESSGNVFADVGLGAADELLTGYSVRQILKDRNLKQLEVAELLDIKQPEVSNLMLGKYHLFSEGRLIHFLNKLDHKVFIQISQRDEGEPFQDVALIL